MRVKNTNKTTVALSVDVGLSLAPGEVMDVGSLSKDALAVKGVVQTKEEIGFAPVKASSKKK